MTTRDALDRIYRERGRLIPEEVVVEARPATHPLHVHFTWDDGEAADLWRQEEARHLIRSVKLPTTIVENGVPRIVHVRAFPNVPTEDGDSYVPLDVVMERQDLQEMLMSEIRREIGTLRRKYEAHLAVFRAVLREEAA
jgi:hypothetical protein